MPEPEKFFLPEKYRTDTSTVTIPIISDVSHLIGDKVTKVGRLLDLRKGEIENIKHAHKSSLEKQNFEVLYAWMLNKGLEATKKRLAEVLIKIGRAKDTIQYIWPELQPATPSSPTPTSPTPTSPTGIDWKGTNNDSSFSFDSCVLRKKDWTKDKTWRNITQKLRDNDSTNFDKLIGVCHLLKSELPKNRALKNCLSSKGNSDIEIDPCMIKVIVDGNCLFLATSKIAFGSADHCCKLRLLTVIELCCKKEHYLKQEVLLQRMKAVYELQKMRGDNVFNDATILALYESCVRDTLKEQFSLNGNLIQLFGLASVLGCNIQSVYPAIGDTKENPLNILIQPRDKNIENLITSGAIPAKAAEIFEDDFIKTFSRDSSQLFQIDPSETIIDVNAMKDEDCLYVPKFSVSKKDLQELNGYDWISDKVRI
ncbi:uncharacterized protein LOC117122082 [Anneissia japonica]|uniref:uncharacterized protein LOC117122082 n=1 Tax=Anneissia japonica TaxID=1529436 RepID=UPI0014259FA8|nr:uncharacterized protein LOC117122082 [Anneissia japonica]